ncbi:unnamed protein product [Cuscuta campestris]|uniref:Uncharacterized protein n=1 Tax=Cuscuta campestris TaxID=132261 RepID=A0A484M8G0_9ASTE|nr:unnamed protein product [Cuscuta campestris]
MGAADRDSGRRGATGRDSGGRGIAIISDGGGDNQNKDAASGKVAEGAHLAGILESVVLLPAAVVAMATVAMAAGWAATTTATVQVLEEVATTYEKINKEETFSRLWSSQGNERDQLEGNEKNFEADLKQPLKPWASPLFPVLSSSNLQVGAQIRLTTMAVRLLSLPFSTSTAPQSKLAQFSGFKSASYIQSFPKRPDNSGRRRSYFAVRACGKPEENNVSEGENRWGKVSAVLFDMDGVLCNSEDPSRRAAVDVFAEMGIQVTVEDFTPFTGMGEVNFLGGVAKVKGIKGFNPDASKKRFFEIYLDKYAKPSSGIGFPGAFELVTQCKSKGLKVAVASSADRIKVDANLTAAGLSLSMFDAIVSADAFENLKPAPDIFLAASKILNVPPSECVVIEDALAGIRAAKAAKMRCIAVATTLAESILEAAAPSLIRKGIYNISLDDILSGGSGSNSMQF